jgi:hypothetical protein
MMRTLLLILVTASCSCMHGRWSEATSERYRELYSLDNEELTHRMREMTPDQQLDAFEWGLVNIHPPSHRLEEWIFSGGQPTALLVEKRMLNPRSGSMTLEFSSLLVGFCRQGEYAATPRRAIEMKKACKRDWGVGSACEANVVEAASGCSTRAAESEPHGP